MAKLTRAIRRNAAANAAAKEGFKRADYFAWRRDYIEQLKREIKDPTKTDKEKADAIRTIQGLYF